MSIFQQQKIKTGDLVIGKRKYASGQNGTSGGNIRYFNEPSLVLEIREDTALVFCEQEGPQWYNISQLEKCYVTDEYANRSLAKD